MKASKKGELRVKQALSAAYSAKENNGPEVGEQFETQVMRRIHTLGRIQSKLDYYFSLLEEYFWWFVPAAAVLTIVLSAWTIQFYLAAEFEMTSLFMNNPVSFDLIQQLLI